MHIQLLVWSIYSAWNLSNADMFDCEILFAWGAASLTYSNVLGITSCDLI